LNTLEKLLAQGNLAQAAKQAEQALAKNGRDRSALVVLGKLRLLQGDAEAAEKFIVRAEQQGSTVDTLVLRANLAGQRGQLKESLGYFEQAIAKGPEHAEALFGRGLILAKLGRMEEGAQSVEKALARDPNNGVFHFRFGQMLEELGETERAVGEFRAAIAQGPQFVPAYLTLAKLLEKSGRPAAARQVLEAGLRKVPGQPRLLAALTNAALLAGDVRGSYQAASKLAASRPDDADAQGNLALLLLTKGQRKEALHLCRTMSSLGKANTLLKSVEAMVYEGEKPPAYEQAIAAWEEAMALSPDDWRAASNLGQLLLRMPAEPPEQQVPRAVTVLEEALRRAPERPEPKLNLALALLRSGDTARSRKLAQELVGSDLPAEHPIRDQAQRLVMVLD
jgi:tetratricopeptide (TPR) repeat protein